VILLAVNFHYVAEDERPDARGVFATPVARLTAQVETLARTFELVSRDELVGAVVGENTLPDRACLLTFDDGLRSQFELALPALERIGAPALFLVPGRPLAEGTTLFVHKTHAVRERLTEEAFARRVEQLVPAFAGLLAEVPSEDAATAYRYDESEVARLKYALNNLLPDEARERVVDTLFAELFQDDSAFARELYMTREQVRELELRHHAVGAHSYAHRPLALLGQAGAAGDLRRNADVLEDVTGVRPLALSYPHGSPAAVSRAVVVGAREAGFVAGFTMERAFNRTLAEPLLLARVDTNEAPGGKRPGFELDADAVTPLAGMTRARTRYFDEAG